MTQPNNTSNTIGDAAHLNTTQNSKDASNNRQTADLSKQEAQNNQVGHIELLEERAVVNKERLDVGKITVSKHQRSKTVEVPIELVEEVLTIRTEYHDADSQDLLTGHYDEKDILRHVEPSLDSVAVVNINGKRIEVGSDPVEIVLTRQVATITKETYAIQEIDIEKSIHTHTDSIQVALRHEELDVKEEGFLNHKNN